MIYSIGEMLIDFMQEGKGYVPYPGGAPANVAIHCKRAGSHAVFVGKLSTDTFGKQLNHFLHSNSVSFDLPFIDKATTLAIVSHDKGERSFQFYRKDTADLYLAVEDINTIPFKTHDILHFCSLGLVPDGTTRQAHLHAINKCKEQGGIVSFDVNLREKLWNSLDEAKEIVKACIQEADIVKVNEDELYWLTQNSSIEEAMNDLQTHGQLIIATCGDQGSYALTHRKAFIHHPITPIQAIDTTGAGDSFIAMILSSLHENRQSFTEWQDKKLQTALEYASDVSSQVVSKQGATPEIEYR